MGTTFRAAYPPPDPSSNGVGVVLTRQEHANLDDETLIAVALPWLAECNDALADMGEEPKTVDNIVIGDWTE